MSAKRPFGVISALLVGAALLYPVSLPGANGLRVTDLTNLFCGGLIMFDIVTNRPMHHSWRPFGVIALLSVPWIGAEIWYGGEIGADSRLTIILMRWLTSLFSAYWLASRMQDPWLRRWIVAGMIAGGLVSLISLAVDPTAANSNAIHQTEMVWVNDDIRGGGIFGHPNAAAAAILLLVPLMLATVSERALPRVFGLLAFVPIIVVFQITQTRSTSLVAVLMIVIWCFRQTRVKGLLGIGLATAASFLLLASLSGVAGLTSSEQATTLADRVMNNQEASSNADDRFNTVVSSIELSLQHPFGMGSSYLQPLINSTGFDATHNAYLELSLLGGIFLTGYVAWRLWRTALSALHSDSVEALTAVYLSTVFLFENLLAQPQMVVLCLWLLWQPEKQQVWSVKHATSS